MKRFLIIILIIIPLTSIAKKSKKSTQIIKISTQPARIYWDPINANIQLEVKITKKISIGSWYLYKTAGANVFGTKNHWISLILYYHLFGKLFKDSAYISPSFNAISEKSTIIAISETKWDFKPGLQIGYQFHWKTFFTRLGYSYPRGLIWDVGVSF
jgi:hypothetical protein